MPLSYAPGEACQFDGSHEVIVNSGVTLTVKLAPVRLCHSRMRFARACMRASQAMVFDAHDRAFAFFKGTCTLYDREASPPSVRGQAEQRRPQRRSSPARSGNTITASCRCAAISLFSRRPLGLDQGRHNERPCRPASGREKGQVENRVGMIRERFFTPTPSGQEPGRVERLAARQMRGPCQGAPPSRTNRQDCPGGAPRGAIASRAACRPVRRLPRSGSASVSKTCTVRLDT